MVDKRCKVKTIDWPKALKAAQKSGLNDYKLADMTGVKRGNITKLRLGYIKDTKTSEGVALLRAISIYREESDK